MFFDPDLIVPTRSCRSRKGAIEPWERRNSVFFHQILDAVGAHFEIDQYVAWASCPRRRARSCWRVRRAMRSSSRSRRTAARTPTSKTFEGVVANLERRFEEYERRRREQGRTTDEDFEAIYDEFHRYMSHTVCEECGGTRLRKEARFVKVAARASPRRPR
jgi:excinuclease ABC subunit A